MRFSYVILITLLNSVYCLCQEAEFLFLSKTSYKWDNTAEGEILNHYFVFKNIGASPIIIEDAKVACPCTKVTFPTYPIAPNFTDSILVTFDTTDKSYYQDRIIELVANTRKTEKLRIKTYVIPNGNE